MAEQFTTAPLELLKVFLPGLRSHVRRGDGIFDLGPKDAQIQIDPFRDIRIYAGFPNISRLRLQSGIRECKGRTLIDPQQWRRVESARIFEPRLCFARIEEMIDRAEARGYLRAELAVAI